MRIITVILLMAVVYGQTAQVQIVHNSPSPTVDIYVDGSLAIEDVAYRASTGLVDLPLSTEVGVAPANGEIIATFPFELVENETYVVVASGIVGTEGEYAFDLLASSLDEEAQDSESFALKVMHGVTDAPAVDIYADGALLVENLAFGDFQGYLQVPVGDYTLDVTAHGTTASVASFSAPLATFGGASGVVYASGFLNPQESDSSFTLILTTPNGDVVELPAAESALALSEEFYSVPNKFIVMQNFPNPFNPSTTIKYDIQENAPVQVTVYDIMGNTVKNLYNGYQVSGLKSIDWDATNNTGDLISSGMYFYKVQVGESYEIKRMMYLK